MSGQIINAEAMARWWGVDPLDRLAPSREGLSTAVWRFDSDTPFDLSSEPDQDVHIITSVLSGIIDCELFIDGRRRYRSPFGVGDFNLVRAGERPRAIEYRAASTFLHLYLPDAALQRYAEEEQHGRRVELRADAVYADRMVHRLGQALYDEMRQGGVASRLVVDGLTLQLAGHFVRNWSNLTVAPPPRGGLAPWQLKRACEAMMARLDGDPGLDELATVVGCSATHFSRAFKQSTGLAPFHWLAERRIEKAKALLDEGRLPLAEIALAVGFAAQPQFTTAFGRATGRTPGQWRRERLS